MYSSYAVPVKMWWWRDLSGHQSRVKLHFDRVSIFTCVKTMIIYMYTFLLDQQLKKLPTLS